MASLVALAMVMASGTGRAGRVQPRGELTQRVSVQVYDIHLPSLAPTRPMSDIGHVPAVMLGRQMR